MHTSTRLHLGIRALVALLVALALLPLLSPAPARAAGFTVTTLDDSGAGSLRQAIEDANGTDGADTITFTVSGTITLASTLPAIDDELTIDGSGQSITISGNNAVRVMVVNPGTTLTLNVLTIANGASDSGGGGLYTEDGTININHGTFSGNSVDCGPNCGISGGAIANRGSVLNVSNSTFAGNSASAGGGGIYSSHGSVMVSNSTFAGNSAVYEGGAIYNDLSSATVSNSTFAGNSASVVGGAIYNARGSMTVSNSTFAGNSAGFAGSIASASSMTLSNTIVANSTAGGDCYGSISANSHTLASDGSCDGATVKSLADLKLGALANNGGPTQTIALLPSSAAIDAGDDAVCAADPVNKLDQRGIARPQGSHCDIGAFEVEQASDTTAPTITITSPTDGAVYLLGQSVAASYACQDEQGGSGLASCTGTVASGANIDTATVGSHSFSVQAADTAGNSASKSVSYQVAYNWSGFFQPIDNLPTVNSAKAGSAVPVKFSLGGNYGLNIFASGYPKVQQVACGSTQADEIEQTVTAGASGLQYDATTGQYSYTWKTDKKWAGTCRLLVLKLIDGSEHIASFTFR